MKTKGKIYLTLAVHNGEMAVYYYKKALNPEIDWPDYEIGQAVASTVEAWHFASRLTPEEMTEALAVPRPPLVDWTGIGSGGSWRDSEPVPFEEEWPL